MRLFPKSWGPTPNADVLLEEIFRDLRRMILWVLVSVVFGACACYPKASAFGCIAIAILILVALVTSLAESVQTLLKKAREDRERNLKYLASEVMDS